MIHGDSGGFIQRVIRDDPAGFREILGVLNEFQGRSSEFQGSSKEFQGFPVAF